MMKSVEEEKEKKGNTKIHLSGKKYIILDGTCMYIAQEVKSKKGNVSYKRLSGYCVDFEHLFNSYLRNEIIGIEVDGELEDLAKFIKKTKAEIGKWTKKLDHAMED